MRLPRIAACIVAGLLAILAVSLFAGPAGARGGLTLGPGQFELPAGSNPVDHSLTAPLLYWRNVTITVADDGTFSYSGSSNVSDAWTEVQDVSNRENTYSGTYTIKIDGDYDTEQKAFSGDFTIGYETIHDYKSVSTTPGLEFTGQGHHIERTGTFSGQVTGAMDLGGGSATLTFEGTDSYNESGTDDSGKPMKEHSGNSSESQAVHFPVSGELSGETFDAGSAEDIEKAPADVAGSSVADELTITGIYGDVTVSDPSVRRGIFALSIKALGSLTGWDQDPEPWRVRVDPEKGMQLTDGFQLKTGDGRAIVKFRDGTRFIIREGSTVTFRSGGMYLETGNFTYSIVKKRKKIYIQDRRSKFSIIGTQFDVATDGQSTTLKVYEGTVQAESAEESGDSINVGAGEELKVTDSGLGAKTALTGAAVDIDALEREIIDGEGSYARKVALMALTILFLVIAVAVAGVVILVKKKGQKKAAVA